MKASRAHALLILLQGVAVTLWISIIAVYRTRRGIFTRDYCDRLLRWWSGKLLRIVHLRCRVSNPHKVRFEKNRLYMIMSNHSSLADIPLTFVALPGSIRMLTKKELFDVPIWGAGLEAGEFISIDRENRRQAIQDLERARKKMESGVILWVAPEGTRSRTGELGPFKKGGFMLALKTRATIIPIGIRGAVDVLPAGTWDFYLGKQAEVNIGKPIDASQYNTKTRQLLMQEVERQIRDLAGLPAPRDGEAAAAAD